MTILQGSFDCVVVSFAYDTFGQDDNGKGFGSRVDTILSS